jgi:F-type H+-transporting ATPase subunit beta
VEAGIEKTVAERQSNGTQNAGENVGRVEEVRGVVIEAVFPERLPEIYNALELEIEVEGEKRRLVAEVQQHVGDDRVRAVAMDSTDGLSRGAEVRDTGGPITVPRCSRRASRSSTCSPRT